MNVNLSAAIESAEDLWSQLLPLEKVNRQVSGRDGFFKRKRGGLTAMEGSHPCA